MIFVRNTNLLVPTKDDALVARTEMAGLFEIKKFKADAFGNKIEKSGQVCAEFPNLILNQGLDRMALPEPFILNACQVGTGSAAPAETQTALQTFLAGTSNRVSTTKSIQSSSPFWGSLSVTYEFAVGAAAGNLTEVGVGWATTGSILFSRALIVDGSGSPITITILSDEILQVIYTLRLYPVEADTPAVVTISGTNYTFTRRPAFVTNVDVWAYITDVGGPTSIAGFGIPTLGGLPAAHSVGMGLITAGPTGTAITANTRTNATYVTGTYNRDSTMIWNIGSANFGVGGIQSFVVNAGRGGSGGGSSGTYQYGVSPAIPKINTQVLTLNHRMTWNRRIL